MPYLLNGPCRRRFIDEGSKIPLSLLRKMVLRLCRRSWVSLRLVCRLFLKSDGNCIDSFRLSSYTIPVKQAKGVFAMFVLVRSDGMYVAPPGRSKSYTDKLQLAWVFQSRESADAQRCKDNETVVAIERAFIRDER
jgi:hypothetical protein